MTKNERIAALEREVEELKKRPQVTYVFPVEPLRPFPAYQLPTYRPYWAPNIYCGTTTVSSHPGSEPVYRKMLGVGGGL